jgi:(4-(4-[2-(gamma-L-glutamylamino)ethyl]phenoxymethyl)furan-2-yl)methanamine synthase
VRRVAVDIGGANLKAARLNGDEVQAITTPFALWRQPDQLALRLAQLLQPWRPFDELAVTMTGELCDCYATRREGVRRIVDAAGEAADPAEVKVYLTNGSMASPTNAKDRPLLAAASNWHALASYVAKTFPHGTTLLLDVGSTTTDIIPLGQGGVLARGRTDSERLATGELVYVGGRRTPLMALGPTVCFQGRPHRVMAERFATTLDVSVLLGRTAPDESDGDTADGRPLTHHHCAARVLRMIGGDTDNFSLAEAVALATAFDDILRQRLGCALREVVQAAGPPQRVVISGSGAALAEAVVADRFAGGDVARVDLRESIGHAASAAACAMALLRL